MAHKLVIPVESLEKAAELLDKRYQYVWMMNSFVFKEFVRMLRERAEKEGWFLEVDE